jgi:hypothetical protein
MLNDTTNCAVPAFTGSGAVGLGGEGLAASIAAVKRLKIELVATAPANKLARIAWSILRNERTFDINRHEAPAI